MQSAAGVQDYLSDELLYDCGTYPMGGASQVLCPASRRRRPVGRVQKAERRVALQAGTAGKRSWIVVPVARSTSSVARMTIASHASFSQTRAQISQPMHSS